MSLIATSGAERSEDGATPQSAVDRKAPNETINIPVDLNIKVGIITSTAEADTEELYSNTRNLYQNFDPSKTTLLTDAQEEDIYLTRNQLHAKVRKGLQNEGLNLEKPVMAYQPLVENTLQRHSGTFYHTVRFGSPEVADSSRVVEKTANVAAPDYEYSYIEHVRTIRQQVTPIYEDIDNIQARVNSLKEKQRTEQKRIERIKSQLKRASTSLSSTNRSIEDDIGKVKKGVAKRSAFSKENSSSGVQLYNRQMLLRLTEEQVCEHNYPALY